MRENGFRISVIFNDFRFHAPTAQKLRTAQSKAGNGIRNTKSAIRIGSIGNVQVDVVRINVRIVGLPIRNVARKQNFSNLMEISAPPASNFEFRISNSDFLMSRETRFGFVIRIFNARAANPNPSSDLT